MEREAFSSSVNGLGPDTLAAGEKELGRLQALKKEMLGSLIEETRTQVGREGGREGGRGDNLSRTQHFPHILSLLPSFPPSLQITAMWEEMSLGLVEREGFGPFRVGMEGYCDDLLRLHEEEVRRAGGREGGREGGRVGLFRVGMEGYCDDLLRLHEEGGREGGREGG